MRLTCVSKFQALVFAGIIMLATTTAHAYTVNYTLDTAQSFLTLTGDLFGDAKNKIPGAPISPQFGNPESLVNHSSGNIKADTTGGTSGSTLTFSFPGESSIVGLANPVGPFQPLSPPGNPYGSIDNYGLHVDATAQGLYPLDVVLRSGSFDISGSLTSGAVPTGALTEVVTSWGQSDVIAGAITSGPETNTTASLASIVIGVGGVETLTLPMRRETGVNGALHIILTGQMVGTRQLKLGDANNDNKVSGADYTIWANSFGGNGSWIQGDFSGDGKVTGADYTIWANHFEPAAAAMPSLAVPEPSTVLLGLTGSSACVAMHWVGTRRRRRERD